MQIYELLQGDVSTQLDETETEITAAVIDAIEIKKDDIERSVLDGWDAIRTYQDIQVSQLHTDMLAIMNEYLEVYKFFHY